MKNNSEERFEILKAMHTLAIATNDENFYYRHWIYVIPDEADDEELRDIAESDLDTFNEAVECFINNFPKYAQRGGLYVGGEVYPKKDNTK